MFHNYIWHVLIKPTIYFQWWRWVYVQSKEKLEGCGEHELGEKERVFQQVS